MRVRALKFISNAVAHTAESVELMSHLRLLKIMAWWLCVTISKQFRVIVGATSDFQIFDS
jgi:hypothetical protein